MAVTATGQPPPEAVQPTPPPQTTTYSTLLNSNILNPKQSALVNTKTIVKPVEIIHGEPTITFSMEERQDFMIEEGLHQAVVFKLSHGAPDLKVLRSILPKQLGTKGNCLIGLLAPRQILLRFDQYEDFVLALSRPVNYLLYNGEEHQYRVFPWSIGYNPEEETTLSVVWISLPNLSPDLFAKKSLLSIASAVGKPIAIDKATQIKSRPSTARVKVILDLMDKLPNRIRLQFVDEKSGKLNEVFQEIVYDNLPLYCNYCKHQGHDEGSCRLISKKNQNNKQIDDTIEAALKGTSDIGKYQGDAREILNEKRSVVGVDQSKVVALDQQLVAATSEQNRANTIDVDTCNIGHQTTTVNKGTTTVNKDEIPRVEVDAAQVDSEQKLIDTNKVEDAENSGQHVLQVENENATNNWTLVAHKNSTTSRTLSLTSHNNSSSSEKGATENFQDNEKRQDISNASTDLLCSNSFDVLLKDTGKDAIKPHIVTSNNSDHEVSSQFLESLGESGKLPMSTKNDNDFVKEQQFSPPSLNSKLSSEAPVFVPKSVIAKKNESRALASRFSPTHGYTIDSGEDSFDEEEEDIILDICFDRVAREGIYHLGNKEVEATKTKRRNIEGNIVGMVK